MPHGGNFVRPCWLEDQRPSAKLSIVVVMPSPPRNAPAPPEPSRSERLRTITGVLSSIVSTGALRTSPWHTDTEADSPSSHGRAPQPPPSIVCSTKLRFFTGSRPKNASAPPSVPIVAAGIRSGIASASEVRIVSTTVGSMRLHDDIGAGKTAIIKLPS
jgi:hypothetical protein